ncbi:MAG TPA: hypothetical protein VGS58_04005 [Candidatus Sulfopaludibacter sp.]|nr:hypothetical protein [Candidatus Sulfopaludibacter sp.]
MVIRLGLLFLAAALARAESPKLPERFQSVVDLSHAAPPEFGADALLRLVESGKVQDLDNRRDLVEQAFSLAVSATYPLRKRHLPGTTLDSRAGSLSQAYGMKLDALSLESRAVSDMVPVDPAEARKLIQEIPPPVFEPLSCDDALFYDVSDFYLALTAVVNSSFSAQERAKEEHLNFLLGYAGQVTSPAQLVPLAQTIRSAGVTNEQREVLWARFNALLPNLQSDDRSFSALLAEPPSGMDFIPAAIRQRSAGCKDDSPGSPANVVIQVNKSGSTPKVEAYWQSAEAQRMMDGGKKLRFGDGGRVLTEAERSTPEWQQRLTDYLSALGAWSPDSEKSEADYYNEKCTVYIALVELIPPGPQRDKMLEAFIDFIGNSPLEQQSPVEWYNQANFLLERMRGSRDGEAAKVLEAFERSGNPVLALETALDKTLGAKMPAWATGSR